MSPVVFLYTALIATIRCTQVPPALCDLAAATVLVSPSTSASVLCGLEDFEKSSLRDFPTLKATTFFDALNNIRLSQELADTRGENTCVVNFNSYAVEAGVRILTNSDQEIKAVAVVIAELKAARMGLFVSAEDMVSLPTIQLHNPDLQVITFVLPTSLDRTSLKSLLRREVKAQGLGLAVFATSPQETAQVLQALLTIGTRAMTLVFTHRAAQFQLDMDRSLFTHFVLIVIAESSCEDAISDCELIKCKLKIGISSSASFSVLVVSSDSQTVIGNITEDQVTICRSCLSSSAGDLQSLSHSSPITLSFNNGIENYNGNANHGEQEMYWGAELAVLDVNNSTTLLSGFRLNLFNVSLGLNLFDAAWATANMQGVKRSDMGVAFLHGHYSNVAIPAYSFIANTMNFTIPQVGSDNTSPLFSSLKNYPLYTRVTMSNTYLSVLYTNVLKRYNWKRMALLYCDDLFCGGLYQEVVKNAGTASIEIVNVEEGRKVSTSVTKDSLELLKTLKEIIESKAKIFMLILYGQSLFATLDALYSLGVRRNDFQFLSIDWLNPTLFTDGPSDSLSHRKELVNGAIQTYPSSFVGPFGAFVQERFKEVFGKEASHFACNNYDSVMLVTHALDYLIALGKEYEVPNVLHKAIRDTKFVGCTGFVHIEDTSNDRSPMTFQILNAVISPNGTVDIREVGIYDPTGLVLFNFTSDIIWADGSTDVPADTRAFSIDCPFDRSDIEIYPAGLAVCYCIILSLSCVTIIFTVICYRRYWDVTVRPLNSRQKVSFDDYMQYATIAAEALQYIAMGPDFLSLSPELAKLTDSLSYRMERLITLKRGLFWLVLNATFGLVAFWGMLLIVVIFNIESRLKFSIGASDIGERLLPLLGSLCFLPVTSMLLNVFQCLHAANPTSSVSMSDVFLLQDCYQRCWRPPHLYYACAALCGFVIYTPFAVYFRPHWQQRQSYLHIQSSAVYFLIKTLYQLLIIAGNKTMKPVAALPHAISFYLITLLFLASTRKFRAYNYARANLWHFLSLLAILWLESLNLLSLSINGSFHWMEVLLSGFAVIATVGVIVQWRRLPPLLFTKKGPSIPNLIRFQFGRRDVFSHSDRPADRYFFGMASTGSEIRPFRRIATTIIPDIAPSYE